MKTLHDILKQVPTREIVGDVNVAVAHLCLDSRKVQKGSCFIAVRGTTADAHIYIDAVIAAGARSIICSTMPKLAMPDVTYVLVADTSAVIGILAAAFYDHPSEAMHVIGITGTNGKTTTATLGHQLFTTLGYMCGLVSTVHNLIGATVVPSTHTTPDAITLQALLRDMADAGCAYVFMEVSSHAVVQSRIAGVQFSIALFSNISHDHLDYHGTFDNYIAAKKKFFDNLPATAIAISNIDDKRGTIMLQNTAARKVSYAIKNMADYKAKILENTIIGLNLDINNTPVHCTLIGEFNAYNLLAVFSIAMCLGMAKDDVLAALSTLRGAVGRFEVVRSISQNILGIVDYAHTPDALINVLATIKKLREGNEQLITVVGCGGDRDKTKRPLMAQVSCEHSDKTVFTSDNPRTEDAQTIIDDMTAGVPPHQQRKYVCILNRKEAIRTACMMAQQNDIILIAGKGHESYQEANGIRTPFDDKLILIETFKNLAI